MGRVVKSRFQSIARALTLWKREVLIACTEAMSAAFLHVNNLLKPGSCHRGQVVVLASKLLV